MKRSDPQPLVVGRSRLHGRKAVAELKPAVPSVAVQAPASSPRPKGRGRIEARSTPFTHHPTHMSPRPKGRGRIEAVCSAKGKPVVVRLHGRKAVAELKPDYAGIIASARGTSPRPKGRGRIEAVLMPSIKTPIGWSPRPKGRGRIEAKLARQLPPRQARSPRPKGRGRIEAKPPRWYNPPGHNRLHGRKAVAELKLEALGVVVLGWAGSPRPKGRGRIEADAPPLSRQERQCLHGRKAVAELKHGRSWTRRYLRGRSLHGRKAVAELKLHRLHCR